LPNASAALIVVGGIGESFSLLQAMKVTAKIISMSILLFMIISILKIQKLKANINTKTE
jgi:hypothetical protein